MKVQTVIYGLGLLILTSGCASYQVAQDVKLLSFTEEPKAKEVSYGSIEGKSCQWNVFGYPIGEQPTMRSAFENAVKGKDGGAIPFTDAAKTAGTQNLSVLRNVSSQTSGMNLYIAHRYCVSVTGLGAQ
jgi:hypothetical protein